uniref:DMT family transporter n=1 Tax=Castellaniella defragrans TaxID=75697 RepID=UPI003340E366
MPESAHPAHLPRHLAIGLLLFIGCTFATNHIAARIAFDDQTGLLLAIMCRSGLCLLTLAGIVLWQRRPLRLPAGMGRWQLLLGLLIALQSLCLYSAVARIPVALALLIANLFPILLALLTWALGGRPPTRRASLLMGIILIGLVLVLDLPAWIASDLDMGPDWIPGILFGIGGAGFFAIGIWVTEHRLSALAGSVRSLYTILIVFCGMVAAGLTGIVPGGMDTPASGTGWLALAALSLLYATAFSVLFISVPRLDMARNAPVMNIEPVASLIMGWLLLNQVFNGRQLAGGAIVLGCIVALAYSKKR